MSLLKIVPDEHNSLFVVVFLGVNPWKRLYKPLFFSCLNQLSRLSSVEEILQTFKVFEVKIAKSQAVKCLAKKSLLRNELEKKLEDKGVSPDSIATAIEFCQAIGALKDSEVLESRIEKELRKGRGLAYARAKLRRLSDNQEINWNSPEKRDLEKKAIMKWVQKKGKSKDLFRFLLRKGFRSELISEVLNE